MKSIALDKATYGFYGKFLPCPRTSTSQDSHAAVIYMLGPSLDGILVSMGRKWLYKQGVSLLVMAPEPCEQGFHSIELERFGAAISWLQSQGITKIGIAGGSATAMLALLVASYYPEISLTVAMTPCDFVMEGYLRDGLDGVEERPADGESVAIWHGEPLPYLPYAYRHPEYWNRVKRESKASKNLIATRQMFDTSEKMHPLSDDMMIPVERISGTLVLSGAQDDCLWDTVRYIQRMQNRLQTHPHSCNVNVFTYQHGTHFLFPQSMLSMGLSVLAGIPALCFAEGRAHLRECKQSRIDLDSKIQHIVQSWLNIPA